MSFSVIDIVFVGLIGLFMIRCYLRGFVTELFSMAAILLGMLASLYFYRNGADFLREQFWPDLQAVPEIIAFVLLFVIVFLIVKLLEAIFKNVIYGIKLGGVDRFLGLIFGFLEGVVVVSLVLFLLRIQPLFDPSQILNDSFFANLLLPLITGTAENLGVGAMESEGV